MTVAMTLKDKIAQAQTTTKRIKSVPSKPGTIGFYTCQEILKMYEDENFVWTGQDTLDMIEKVVTWAHEKGIETKFKNTHVSYFRSVLKQNEKISY